MSDRWRRWILLLLPAAILIPVLTACGSDDGGATEEPGHTDWIEADKSGETAPPAVDGEPAEGYRSDIIALPDEIDAVSHLEVAGDRIYFVAREYQRGVSCLYYADMDGENLGRLELPTRYSEAFFAGLVSDGEGGVWICQVEYSYDYDVDTLEERTADYTTGVLHVSRDLEIIETRDLADFDENTGIQSMCSDGRGIYLLLSGAVSPEGSVVRVYTMDMELVDQLMCDGTFYSMQVIGDAVCLRARESGLVPVEGGGTLGEKLPLNPPGTVHSSRDGRIYYTWGARLYSCAVEEEAGREERRWGDVHIAESELLNLLVLEDGSMVGTTYKVERQSAELVIISPPR